jgi:hypothetical protein
MEAFSWIRTNHAGRVFVYRNITYTMTGSVSLWPHVSNLSRGGGTVTPLQPESSVKIAPL